MNARELVQEYFRRTGMHRTDLDALAEFVEARELGQLDGLGITRLFWHAIRPRQVTGGDAVSSSDSIEESSNLPDDIEKEYLEQLLMLGSEMRVHFTPDLNDLSDPGANYKQYRELVPYLHVAAASAIRRQRIEGFSEKVAETLDDVWRELLRLQYTGYLDPDLYGPLPGNLGEDDSLYGVMSLVASLVCRSMYAQGNYDESFQCGVESVIYCQAAFRAADYSSEREYFYDAFGNDLDKAEKEIRIREVVGSLLSVDDLEPQQIVKSFEGIREHGGSIPWRLVAIQCSLLGLTDIDDLSLSDVSDTDGTIAPWDIYWHRAGGWAEAQLSQNELREFLRQHRERASETALKVYFLRETWDKLPKKVQDNLVYAERIWFESQREDFGAVPIHLRVAVAAMCYEYIWEPMRRAKGGQDLLEFKKLDSDLSQDNRSPNLANYIRVCSQQFFRSFVQGKGLSQSEQEFLVSDAEGALRNALYSLQTGRNIAEHEHERLLTRDEIKPLVDLFFGIGQPGVLRRLAEIGPKLAGK